MRTVARIAPGVLLIVLSASSRAHAGAPDAGSTGVCDADGGCPWRAGVEAFVAGRLPEAKRSEEGCAGVNPECYRLMGLIRDYWELHLSFETGSFTLPDLLELEELDRQISPGNPSMATAKALAQLPRRVSEHAAAPFRADETQFLAFSRITADAGVAAASCGNGRVHGWPSKESAAVAQAFAEGAYPQALRAADACAATDPACRRIASTLERYGTLILGAHPLTELEMMELASLDRQVSPCGAGLLTRRAAFGIYQRLCVLRGTAPTPEDRHEFTQRLVAEQRDAGWPGQFCQRTWEFAFPGSGMRYQTEITVRHPSDTSLRRPGAGDEL